MVNGFHVGVSEGYTQVGKESTSEHWNFTALHLRERIICVGYMLLINRLFCDQAPTIIFQKQIHLEKGNRNVSARKTKSMYRVAQNTRYIRCLTRCF
jgi:hypothetical protein